MGPSATPTVPSAMPATSSSGSSTSNTLSNTNSIEQETLDILNAPFINPDQELTAVPSLVDLRPLSQLLEHLQLRDDQRVHRQQQQQQATGTPASIALNNGTNSNILNVSISNTANSRSNNSNHVSNRSHHRNITNAMSSTSLLRALDRLEALDRSKQTELRAESSTIAPLTSMVTRESHTDSLQALERLQALGSAIPRRVCQFPFKRNDIVWVCRTCQADETCVLCHACFKGSNHEGHDVAFYHAQAGGCCDCGDPDAWSPDGFCQHHGSAILSPSSSTTDDEAAGALSQQTMDRVQIIVQTSAQWLVDSVCEQTLKGRERVASVAAAPSPLTPSLQAPVALPNVAALPLPPPVAHPHEWTFRPEAASTSKSRGDADNSSTLNADDATVSTRAGRALELGRAALEGHGIYLVLHADDVHTKLQVSQGLRAVLATSGMMTTYTESLMNKLVLALHHHGQLVLWGSAELLADMTTPQRLLFADGDKLALERLGASLLERAARLSNQNWSVRIVTRRELLVEQRAVALLEWCTAVARSCDPLCQTVACNILPQPHLAPMLRADFTLSARIIKAWHSLLLTLLAVPTFKSHLAVAYCDTYRDVTAEYAQGMGVLERSSYTLSVQFLNRVTYVVDLVQRGDLLGKLGKALLETLSVAKLTSAVDGFQGHERLNPNHYVLAHRRYSPCISDLKCVLNVKGMARLFSSGRGTFLNDWLSSLKLANWMDLQIWRTFVQGHVEIEPRGWVAAFNASISLGSLFERLLCWDDDDTSPAPDSPLSLEVPTIVELANFCLLQALVPWHLEEIKAYNPTSNSNTIEAHRKAPTCLPFPTVHCHRSNENSALAFAALPVSQLAPWSFHLPLHRFVAASLREVARRPEGMSQLLIDLQERHSDQTDALAAAILEFPVIVLARAAQVRAGLWRRNGSFMLDQVLNYAEPPFCRALRDADVNLLQFATLVGGKGTGHTIALLLHRFGLFDFLGMASAPTMRPDLYKEQVSAEMYVGEAISTADEAISNLTLPWTFTPAEDVTTSLLLLEEFLHLLIVLVSELPPTSPTDKAEHVVQAKQRLRREVIHRLASGPKTHSELAEVHHVLSSVDNSFLSEEGKKVNPDDATGAALSATLDDVAEHKAYRGKLEASQWVLKDDAWEDYDPAFFHISLRDHQQAAEDRPTGKKMENVYGIEAKCVCPPISDQVHPSFERLRKDVTSDGTFLAIVYRIIHVHCRDLQRDDLTGLRGASAYGGEGRSETALARAVQLLTLGALSWQNADSSVADWRQHGGSYEGSIFFNESATPTTGDWIARVMLSKPSDIMDCEWYDEEESLLLLLKRLAIEGGNKSAGFMAQDLSVRSGAAWLCEYASSHNAEACAQLGSKEAKETVDLGKAVETDMDRKKREAKARAVERMNAQAARFAAMMQIDTEDSEDEKEQTVTTNLTPSVPVQQDTTDSRRLSSASFVGSEASFASEVASVGSDKSTTGLPLSASSTLPSPLTVRPTESNIPARLLKTRPRCIICNEDNPSSSRDLRPRPEEDSYRNRKRSRRRTDRNSALGFVGYTQPSTVLKGGGGAPPSNDNRSSMASSRRFVGVHVALCGHAVHSECCESYLATVLHRDDRISGRPEEFKCPLCQRLSNCLVPFIDVGLDWIHPPEDELMSLEDDSTNPDVDIGGSTKLHLDGFLKSTPWWVGRDDTSIAWDGQSAFVAALPTQNMEGKEPADVAGDVAQPKARRRSVRPLRKKDLYAAWSAMMRTPRFIRKRQLQQAANTSTLAINNEAQDASASPSVPQLPIVADTSMGETLVWRRFMDIMSDMANRADSKRLGEQSFLQYCGEFRHYQTEKYAHNASNRLAGKDSLDWPACISSVPLPDTRRQELSREKLLSKLLMTIQGFTYSCCAEAFEVKRLLKKETENPSGGETIHKLLLKFGIAGLTCDGKMIRMQAPNENEDDGFQPFGGRLGRLRYLGLATMAAAGAVSADLVQIVLNLPLSREAEEPVSPPAREDGAQYRAPVAFPVLFGHVLTHTVAAMCATCGRGRARSDSLEVVWPMPFSKRGSFARVPNIEESEQNSDCVSTDCEGFIKLGLLARILQVLLGRMQMDPGSAGLGKRVLAIKSIRQGLIGHPRSHSESQECDQWIRGCAALFEASISQDADLACVASAAYGSDFVNRFKTACKAAANAAISFLSDAGTIYQILVPGVKLDQDGKTPQASNDEPFPLFSTLDSLFTQFGLERIDEMLESQLVRHVVSNWFNQACVHTRNSETNRNDIAGGLVQKRLFQTESFRVYDWPMDSCNTKEDQASDGVAHAGSAGASLPDDIPMPMKIDTPLSRMKSDSSTSMVAFSSRKSVHLIGSCAEEQDLPAAVVASPPQPQVQILPTSYTDLYAELGRLCPDYEQTALCLICGTVLNANGKGECTKHSFKCGAGSGIFFLLQECQGLILHHGKAVYVQSPFVDSHGETPQYRGRPLNLDLDRYDLFHELWAGHSIREKVVQERANARQVIITDFY